MIRQVLVKGAFLVESDWKFVIYFHIPENEVVRYLDLQL